MVLVNVQGKEFYLDGFLKKNFDYIIQQVLQRKNMCVVLIDGRTGTGKSTLAATLAYYCSRGNMTLDHEVFSTDQFVDGLNNLQIGQALVLDEAFDLLNKRKTQSMQNMINISMLQQARIKQGFIFIALPSVFDLDKNIILNLADLFIHCYRKSFGKRGQFACYDRQRLKNLWLFCRQSYSYNHKVALPNFYGRFTSFFPFDVQGYEKKKSKTLEEMKLDKGDRTITEDINLDRRNNAIVKLKQEGKNAKELMDLFQLKERQIYKILKEGKKQREEETET